MNLKLALNGMAVAAAAVLLASCGGGGGDHAGDDAQAALEVSGTAATGAALASASVQVKCKSGDGTATTSSSGGYTVTITGGALPCIIKVSGTTAAGVPVTLHSIVESGTADGSTTEATANVTPVTEMIVAQLMATLPGDAFTSFDPAQVTKETVSTALTAIVDALKAAGVDLTGIDPLKATLVPATGTTEGNPYDKLLDTLGDKVPPEALPLVVAQIATAAESGSSSALDDAMTAVAKGSLENCPAAISGKYRVIDFRGAMATIELDFARMKVIAESTELTMTANSAQACEVSVADGNETVFVLGASGVGLVRDTYTTGYIFPVQALSHSQIVGEWSFVEAGQNESDETEKFFGKLNFAADRSVTLCEYDLEGGVTSTCHADTETGTITDRTDGGLLLALGDFPAQFYGYKSPSGSLTLFGTNNPSGSHDAVMKSHFVAFQNLASVPLPQEGEVRKSWNLLMRQATSGAVLTSSIAAETQRISNVNATAGTYDRVFDSAPTTIDTFKINTPFTGLVERTNRAYIYALAVPGTGLSIALDAPGNAAYLYSSTLQRP